MPQENPTNHVYQRTVSGDANDSLSLIANLIEPGQTLLDLGMGTGGLGQHLSQQFALVADGVTLNNAEAEIASKWYRHTLVANLDTCDISALLAGEQYDCIVCADVLEHLKAPDRLLVQCKTLLKPGGRLISSVPNAGYCGLIAELIQGEFRYRPEGLLDNTHLRFFTRRSLLRFFEEHGWRKTSIQTTRRDLPASEFKVAFDSLPPAVARHLLALPDALTYQFVTELRADSACTEPTPDNEADAPLAQTEAETASAIFSVQLYLATQGNCSESNKLVTAGAMGVAKQLLTFDIPPSNAGYTRLRLDPADRPGFFKLRHLRVVLPDGSVAWQWLAAESDAALLNQSPHQQMLFQSPWEFADDTLLFLYGDDPWVELPLSEPILQQIATQGARLEVCCGWPMSADFAYAGLASRTAIEALKSGHQAVLRTLQVNNQQLQTDLDAVNLQLGATTLAMQALQSTNKAVAEELILARRSHASQSFQISQMQRYLQTIEQSTVFRATRPLVNLKMKLSRLVSRSADQSAPGKMQNTLPLPLPLPSHPVDIIVPVYKGIADTRRCIESVLQSTCQTSWRLIVINDCSPEPELTDWLKSIAATDGRITLLENTDNLGFVGTVNRGMAESEHNDVLLLNSDTEVANDWLDRIQRAAYSTARVASVTPFSNNATICSYPRFCASNELPLGYDTAALDLLFSRHLGGQTIPIPTGVGFCMYVRRECLRELGLFDEHNFGKGYGEENDFCQRAILAGWTNLHALDTFVRHSGGVSFGDSKSEREQQAGLTMLRLHPNYDRDVQAYVARDPAKFCRTLIDVARIRDSGRIVVLSVVHNREGGTLRHTQELATALQHKAVFVRLSPATKGVTLALEGPGEVFSLHLETTDSPDILTQTLKLLCVGHVHFHHLLGHAPTITEIPQLMGVTHDFTAHDYYSFCPQVSLTDHTDRYCGETGITQCQQCLRRNPAPGAESIESWRIRHLPLLVQARYVLCPSVDTAKRVLKFAPGAGIRVVPHVALEPTPEPIPAPEVAALKPEQPLKIAVLGALSKIKGADTLEGVALLAARHGAPVEFHLIGYAYRNLQTQPKARLSVHGSYQDDDLPLLLEWLKPDVVWFPAQCPETYSYTLSASLTAGLPIVAPDLGAFGERLQNRAWTWICDWQWTMTQWLDFFVAIRSQNFLAGQSPGPCSPTATSIDAFDQSWRYHCDYLAHLPAPEPVDKAGVASITQIILDSTNSAPGFSIKPLTLSMLTRMRFIPAFSALAKLIPTHLQRRTKSWLGQ